MLGPGSGLAGSFGPPVLPRESGPSEGPAPSSIGPDPGPRLGVAFSAGSPLDVTIEADPANGTVEQVFEFVANATGGSGGGYSYAWDLGDGTHGTGPSMGHTFSQPGAYSVSVFVTDGSGNTARATLTVLVYAVTVVAIDLAAEATAVTAGSNFSVIVTATPVCSENTVPDCATEAIPISMAVRVNNSTGSPDILYLGEVFPPGTPTVFVFPAPAVVGGFDLAAIPAPPQFSGLGLLRLTVEGPTTSGSGAAAYGLLALGVGVGTATSLATIIATGGRPPTPPPPAGPGPRTEAPPERRGGGPEERRKSEPPGSPDEPGPKGS